MGTTTLLRSLFEHKAWINEGFFDALAKLDAEARSAQRHAAIRLLNHIYVVDRIFAGHLTGKPHGYASTNTQDTPTLEALRDAVRETDRWYVGHVASLPAERLGESIAFTFTDGERGRMSREEMLAHVVTHGSYHRGEVGRILTQVGVPPPRDLYTVFLHQSEPQRRMRA